MMKNWYMMYDEYQRRTYGFLTGWYHNMANYTDEELESKLRRTTAVEVDNDPDYIQEFAEPQYLFTYMNNISTGSVNSFCFFIDGKYTLPTKILVYKGYQHVYFPKSSIHNDSIIEVERFDGNKFQYRIPVNYAENTILFDPTFNKNKIPATYKMLNEKGTLDDINDIKVQYADTSGIIDVTDLDKRATMNLTAPNNIYNVDAETDLDDDGVEDEEYDDNIGEGRDLDAEEDADWEDRIASGEIRDASDWNTGVIREADIATAVASSQANVARRRRSQVTQQEEIQSDEPLIPENSPTLTSNDATSRFSGTEWYEEIQKKKITFAGLGGIGSWSCLLIGRMALQTFSLFDDDKVEMTNMSGQLYSRNQIGKFKAEAMRELLSQYTSTISTYANRRKFTDDDIPSDIMICGFDNMEARKTFFISWMKHMRFMSEEQKKQCLFIDGRLSIDTLQVFCIQGTDVEAQGRYEENYLFSDEEADETICSMKQTSYLAAMIGSVITNLFTNWVANSLDPIIPYDLPFYTEYNAQHMIFKTEH